MNGMAVSDALRAWDGERHERRFRAVKLALRILVSVALLAILIIKIPSDTVEPKDTGAGTLTFLIGALVLTFAGFVLSAWRWQRVLAVFDEHVGLRTLLGHYLAGQFVGNVLPSTDRRRRAACEPGVEEDRELRRRVRVGRDRASHRVRRAPAPLLLGILIRPSLLDVQHAWIAVVIALDHARRAARRPRGRRLAPARGPVREARELDALHRRGAHRRRPHAPEPGRATSVVIAAVAYQVVGGRGRVVRDPRRSASRSPTAPCIAFVPVVAMAQVLPISLGGLGVREGLLVLLLHPLGVSDRQGDRGRPALVRHDPRRQPARRTGVRGGPPPRRAAPTAGTAAAETSRPPPDVAREPHPRRTDVHTDSRT